MSQEYEIITHGGGSYHLFMVNMLYRTPHIHLDFEFLLVLSGNIDVVMSSGIISLSSGEICIINPLQSHEFRAASPALLLSLQVPPSFFSLVCPEADHIEFSTRYLTEEHLREILLHLAEAHFQHEEWSELYCCSMIFLFFHTLIRNTDYQVQDAYSWQQALERGSRLRRILDYIDSHYSERIRLQDIAEEMHISSYYLSHSFKETMGISIQQYVMRFRCEQARRMLLVTDNTSLDISLACGFSDPKYMTREFVRQYGMRPGEYRTVFRGKKIREQQTSMLSTQEFLSDEASLVLLGRFYSL